MSTLQVKNTSESDPRGYQVTAVTNKAQNISCWSLRIFSGLYLKLLTYIHIHTVYTVYLVPKAKIYNSK